MSISEHITPFHLGRKALIYIRQSSPHQALTNQESQHLQYALRQRAHECGWADEAIEVIDTDLGRTASTTQGRQGFKEIVARVTLDQVGIIFSYDVTRLSRNCTDWYQVLDLAGTALHDRRTRRDIRPARSMGALLGLRARSGAGAPSIKARRTAGLINKAALRWR